MSVIIFLDLTNRKKIMLLHLERFVARLFSSQQKIAERKAELARYVSHICDPRGCRTSKVDDYYKRCKHLVNHYGLSLKEAGFDGDLQDLFVKCVVSSSRSARREKVIVQAALKAFARPATGLN